MAKFNILSIDGGGIKGIISAVVIEKLEKILKKRYGDPQIRIGDCFDLIAGTSTGAILTGIYLCPDEMGRPKYSASDAVKLYVENGEFIFSKSIIWRIKTLFQLAGSKYNNKNLSSLLEKYLGDTALSELVKPCLIASYDMGNGVPFFFTSHSSKTKRHKDYLAKDAVLASASAPTYFPPALVTSKRQTNSFFIDGGMFSNNPAMCAVAEAIKLLQGNRLEDISVLSIGNISSAENHDYEKTVNYGLLQWVLPAIDIMMESSVQTANHQLEIIYKSINKQGQYLRIDAGAMPHGQTPKMDDANPENIKHLVKIGEELAHKSEYKLRKFVEMMGIG